MIPVDAGRTSGGAAGSGAPVRRWSVDVGAVVWGLVLVVTGAGVLAREVFDVSWDWRWSVAGVLVVAGTVVVLTTAVSALRAGSRGDVVHGPQD